MISATENGGGGTASDDTEQVVNNFYTTLNEDVELFIKKMAFQSQVFTDKQFAPSKCSICKDERKTNSDKFQKVKWNRYAEYQKNKK